MGRARARRHAGLALTVRAAGGVVVREGAGGTEVLLVHRPRYDDWTFPKGKCNRGETDETCALREVEEETGLRCRLVRELVPTTYTDARGRPKTVRYWLMEELDGEFAASDEVDTVRWVGAAAARGLLSYGRDAAVMRDALD